jgi:XTP/dITP diphosphohydrolase
MELLLVSFHLEKVRELKRILQDTLPDVVLTSLLDFVPPQKEEESFEARAAQNAISAAASLGKPCLAEESGLVIPHLGKEKMFQEARHSSGLFLPDNKKILRDLKDTDDSQRTAFLECSLSFATPQHGLVKTATCRMEGFIASQEKGSSPFDFASIFIKYEYNKTLAELTPSVKSRISHRRKVCDKLLPFLRSYFLKKTP